MKTTFLPKYFLSAAIGLLPTYAMAQPKKPETTVTVHGSETTLKPLSRIMGSFKKLAGMDVIVVSPDDLLSAREKRLMNLFAHVGVQRADSIGEYALSKRMKAVLQRHEHIFLPSERGNPTMDNFTQTLWSNMIVNEAPFSSQIQNPKTDQKVCFIGAYDHSTSARKMLTTLAFLPPFMAEAVQTNIPADILYSFIMLHEAQHCAQDHNEAQGTAERSVQRLHNELDADRRAFQELRKIYKKKPTIVERAITEIKRARSLSTLRGAHSILQGQHSHLSHGGFLSDDDEKNPRNAADVILASGMANVSHYMTGFLFSITSSASQDARMTVYKQSFKDRKNAGYRPDNLLAVDDPYELGKYIAHNFPMVEYAQYKMIHQLLQDNPNAKELEGLRKHASFQTLETIIKNYVESFEKLIPTAIDHPMVIDYRAIMQEAFEGIKNKPSLPEKKPIIDPDEPKLPVPETLPRTSLDALKLFEEFRIYLAKQRVERQIKQDKEDRKFEEEWRKRHPSQKKWFEPSP